MCNHPTLVHDECDPLEGRDYYVCIDCQAVFYATCAIYNPFVGWSPWDIPPREELTEYP